jgi:hypothetical protein
MAMLPLNRLRTRLSMPLGFLQLGSTHLNRSLWNRLKRFVPVQIVQVNFLLLLSAMASYPASRSSIMQAQVYVRFFTIGTCFLEAVICEIVRFARYSSCKAARVWWPYLDGLLA